MTSGVMKMDVNRHRRLGLGVFLWGCFAVGWQQSFHVPWERRLKPDGGHRAFELSPWSSLSSIARVLPLWRLDPFGVSGEKALARSVRDFSPSPALWEVQMMADMESNIRKLSGPVISEDMNFTLSIDKEIWIQTFEFAQLHRQGLWNFEPLNKAISAKEFGALILMFELDEDISAKASVQRFLPETLRLMGENYKPWRKWGPYRVYVPR